MEFGAVGDVDVGKKAVSVKGISTAIEIYIDVPAVEVVVEVGAIPYRPQTGSSVRF